MWTTAVLVLVPGLIFIPAKGENLFQVASAGDGGYGAFGAGLLAAWLAMFSVLFVAMPVALGIEELAYRRSQPSPRGSTSIRVATQIIVGYAIAASLAALAIAQLVVTG